MPNYASPFLDTQPPAQYAGGGGTGAVGQFQSTLGGNVTVNGQSNANYDTNLGAKLAGTIALALIVVFVLQKTGFRFVVAAGIGQ